MFLPGFWVISPFIRPLHFSCFPHSESAFHWEELSQEILQPQQPSFVEQYLSHSFRANDALGMISVGNRNVVNAVLFVFSQQFPFSDRINSFWNTN